MVRGQAGEKRSWRQTEASKDKAEATSTSVPALTVPDRHLQGTSCRPPCQGLHRYLWPLSHGAIREMLFHHGPGDTKQNQHCPPLVEWASYSPLQPYLTSNSKILLSNDSTIPGTTENTLILSPKENDEVPYVTLCLGTVHSFLAKPLPPFNNLRDKLNSY